MLTVNGSPEHVMSIAGSDEHSHDHMQKTVEKRPVFNWKGFIFNTPLPDQTGMIPLGEIIPVLFLLMSTDSKEERQEIMKLAMMELRDSNGARYFPV